MKYSVESIKAFIKYRQVANHESFVKVFVRLIICLLIMSFSWFMLEYYLVMVLWIPYSFCMLRLFIVTMRGRKKDLFLTEKLQLEHAYLTIVTIPLSMVDLSKAVVLGALFIGIVCALVAYVWGILLVKHRLRKGFYTDPMFVKSGVEFPIEGQIAVSLLGFGVAKFVEPTVGLIAIVMMLNIIFPKIAEAHMLNKYVKKYDLEECIRMIDYM